MREQRCGVGESGANDGDYNTSAICVRSVRLYVVDAIADNVQDGQRVWYAVYSARVNAYPHCNALAVSTRP